jgi:hypothetical protein
MRRRVLRVRWREGSRSRYRQPAPRTAIVAGASRRRRHDLLIGVGRGHGGQAWCSAGGLQTAPRPPAPAEIISRSSCPQPSAGHQRRAAVPQQGSRASFPLPLLDQGMTRTYRVIGPILAVPPGCGSTTTGRIVRRPVLAALVQVESRRTARVFVLGLLSDVDGKSCWRLRSRPGMPGRMRCSGCCAPRAGMPRRSATMCGIDGAGAPWRGRCCRRGPTAVTRWPRPRDPRTLDDAGGTGGGFRVSAHAQRSPRRRARRDAADVRANPPSKTLLPTWATARP